jgi:hypothetical protein
VNMSSSQIFMCRASSSFSSVIGNVSLIVRRFMEGLFPPSFFKYVYIDTSMTSLAFENEDVFKHDKPILVIRPKVSLSDDTIFGRLPDWMSTNYFVFKNLRNNYTPVFVDFDKEIYIYSVPDRIKLTFEIEIICASKMQQINIGQYLKGSVLHKGYFYLGNSYIETEVPKYFIKTLSNYMNVDMTDATQKSNFLNYLDTRSQSFITEKIKTSSGNPAYFYIYNTNILCQFEDYPQLDDGEEKDLTSTNFRITETFTADFSCPSNFFLETKLPPQPNNPPLPDYSLLADENGLLLNYTMKFIPPKELNINNVVFSFLRKQGYITDADPKLDELDLNDFFSPEMKSVIAYNNKYKIDNNEVFKINLYREDTQVDPANINIQWDTLTLQNFNPSPQTTYHIFAYGDRDKINRTTYRLEQINGNVYQQ